jgi:hypothetical protein
MSPSSLNYNVGSGGRGPYSVTSVGVVGTRTYPPPFIPAEWRLQQSQSRLAKMDFDSACDRAKSKMDDCSR